ncbi:hypothetical protein D3C75_875980 [compost metagenome]
MPFASQQLQICFVEGLHSDADPGHARFLQHPQLVYGHIGRMKLQSDALGNLKETAGNLYNPFYLMGKQSGSTAAEIQRGHFFTVRAGTAHYSDFLFERRNISPSLILPVDRLAIRAKLAQAPAERDVDIQAQIPGIRISQA